MSDLKTAREHGLKMNPSKCVFGVIAGNFLKFLVHNRGVEIDKKKSRAIKALKKQKGVAALDKQNLI